MVKGIASGNLALSAAILFCGLTYTKVANMAMLLNMPIFSESTFHRLQKEYLYPIVHTAYVQQQQTVTEFLRGKPLQLSGDGRCDSPGHSAKYCTYSLMDSVTDLILDYSLVQVTETVSSVAMETEGLQRCLSNVLSSGLQIEAYAERKNKKMCEVVAMDPIYHKPSLVVCTNM